MNQPFDTLFINQLTIPCVIGAFESERKEKQLVVIDIELSVDTKKAGKTDNLADTVNYHDIAKNVGDMVSNSQYMLLERLAQAVADICLSENKIKKVKIRIEKPKAVKLARSAAIEIVRYNEE